MQEPLYRHAMMDRDRSLVPARTPANAAAVLIAI